MTRKDIKQELAAFAHDEIPTILAEHGGRLEKDRLREIAGGRFRRHIGYWPKELDEIEAFDRRRASNAIAHALKKLNDAGRTHRSTGSTFVELRGRPALAKTSKPRRRVSTGTAPGQAERIEAEVRKIARSAISRAKHEGVPSDSSFVEDSVDAVRQVGYRCALSNREFDLDFRTPGAGGGQFRPSPDRIDPQKGYVHGNVVWILWCINRGIGTMQTEDFIELCLMIAAKADREAVARP